MSLNAFKETAKTVGEILIKLSKNIIVEYTNFMGAIDKTLSKGKSIKRNQNTLIKLSAANSLFQTASIGFFNELYRLRTAAFKAAVAGKDDITEKARNILRDMVLYVEQIEVVLQDYSTSFPQMSAALAGIKDVLYNFRTKIDHATKTIIGGRAYDIVEINTIIRTHMNQLRNWNLAAKSMKPAQRKKYKELIKREICNWSGANTYTELKAALSNDNLRAFIAENTDMAKRYVVELHKLGAVYLTKLIDYYGRHRLKYLPSTKTTVYEVKTKGDTICICVQDDIANIKIDMENPSKKCFINNIITTIKSVMDALNKVDRKIIHKMAKKWKKNVREIGTDYIADFRKTLKDAIINKLEMLKLVDACSKLKPMSIKTPKIGGDSLDKILNLATAYYEAEKSVINDIKKLDKDYQIVIADLQHLFKLINQLIGRDTRPCIRVSAMLPLAIIQIQYHKGDMPQYFNKYKGSDLKLINGSGKINKKNLDKYISLNIC